MTTLISWAGVIQGTPSSLYLAADSRFTWAPGETWDYGRKLFASRTRPDILGYCGDVVFASQTLAQALDMLDNGMLPTDEACTPDERLAAITDFLSRSFETYPDGQKRPFHVLYATRLGTGSKSSFVVMEVSWSKESGWSSITHALPPFSDVVVALGSGRGKFRNAAKRWGTSDIGGTSRAIYSAFCDHVASGDDPATGGAPQLVGLYRKGPAITYGVIHAGSRWISGAPVAASGSAATEWRDNLFQRCDGENLDVLSDAQRHARPGRV